jgi:Flp pilus assembly protein TadB
LIPVVLLVAVFALVLVRRRGGRDREDLRDLAASAGAMARDLRQGAGLNQAVIDAAEAGRDPDPDREPAALEVLANHLRSGGTLEGSVDSWIAAWNASCRGNTASGQIRTDDLELVGNALRMGQRFGGDTPAALDAVASTLTQRADLADETAALTSQAKASMWTLCALPVVAAGVFATVDPGVGNTLVGTTVGRVCLAVGLTLEAASFLVARTIVNRTLR